MSSIQDHNMQEDAASALTNLQKANEDKDSNEFVIPQRFTKSGRKKAVPFPLKVSIRPLLLHCSSESSPSIV